MEITKLGHACILVKEGEASILIDPGSYNPQPEVERLDAILITHNHQDHLDPEQISMLLVKHPDARVITCAEAGATLAEKGIKHEVIKEGEMLDVAGVSIQAHGRKHALIYGDMPQCENTGFLIAGRLYHPGDALHVPEISVEILALPVAGPWMKLGECIDYAKEVKPKAVFPIHDGMMRPDRTSFMAAYIRNLIEPDGIEFRGMQEGSVEEF